MYTVYTYKYMVLAHPMYTYKFVQAIMSEIAKEQFRVKLSCVNCFNQSYGTFFD